MATVTAASSLVGRIPAQAHPGIEVLVLDAERRIAKRWGGTIAIADDDGRWREGELPPDVVAIVTTLERGACVVAIVPQEREAVLRPLAEGFGLAAAEVARLENDMESMNSSSLALLEQVAMVDELVSRLPSCVTDEQVVRLGLENLLVAASVRYVAYVAWDERTGHCTTRLALEADADGVIRELPARDRPFDPAISLVDAILSGGRDEVMVDVPTGGHLGTPGLPEAVAQREFLAVPVRFGDSNSERTLGAIVLADKQANRYSNGDCLGTQESKLAAMLARMVGSAVGSRMVAAVGKEIGLAREIQQQILPEMAGAVAGFDLAGRCETSGAVGGDYYDFVPMADGRTMALVADVSGHNLASGMVMVAARTALRLLASRCAKTADVITGVGDALNGDLTRTERFISVAGVAMRPDDRSVDVVNAGHADVLVRRAGTRVIDRFESTDAVLGFMPGIHYRSVKVDLTPGDVMLLYTDGVVEAQDAHGEMFGDQRLERVLAGVSATSAAAVLDAVFGAVAGFASEGHGGDDVTVVVIRCAGDLEGART